MELLCRCDDIPDDGIELRVLKGLLTAVTSNAVHVHGQALLLVRLTVPYALIGVKQFCLVFGTDNPQLHTDSDADYALLAFDHKTSPAFSALQACTLFPKSFCMGSQHSTLVWYWLILLTFLP